MIDLRAIGSKLSQGSHIFSITFWLLCIAMASGASSVGQARTLFNDRTISDGRMTIGVEMLVTEALKSASPCRQNGQENFNTVEIKGVLASDSKQWRSSIVEHLEERLSQSEGENR